MADSMIMDVPAPASVAPSRSLKTTLARMVIPPPLLHVYRRVGLWRMVTMLFAIGWSSISVAFYLWRKRGFDAAWKFVSVKLFTPVGPGGAGVAWFFFGWFIRRYPLLYRFPRQLEMEITTRCSKRCIHCEHTYWPKESQVRKNLGYDEIVRVLEQFPTLRWASLVGEGDTFRHPDMMELVKYLRSRNIMNYMPEHMSDWTDETFKTVVEEDMDGIIVSFDAATAETYEKLKRGCGFEKVVANIKKLVEEKKKRNSPLPEITFIYIAMKDNIHEIPEFVDLVADIASRAEYGASSRIGVVRLLTFKQILDLQVDEIPKEIVELAQERARARDVFINFTGTNERELLPPPECCLAWMEPYIFMPGHISQCCSVFISNNRDFIREHAHGNVYEEDFKAIWNNKSYKTLRYLIGKKDAPIPMQCANCRVFDTLPREKKHGIIDTHTGEVMSLREFHDEHLGENMKWRYEDVDVNAFDYCEPHRYADQVARFGERACARGEVAPERCEEECEVSV